MVNKTVINPTNKEVKQFTTLKERKFLSKQLKKESKLVRKESMKVLAEFETVEIRNIK